MTSPRLRDYVSVPLQLAHGLLVIVSAAVFAGLVSRLPDEIPGYERWSLGGLVLFDVALLWVIVWAVAKDREIPPERRRNRVRSIEWVMLVVDLAVVIVWLAIPLQLGGHALVGPAVVTAVVLATLGAIVAVCVAGLDDEPRDAGWRWGGRVYYAPDDPALFVPKRVGIGRTLNLARASAWGFLTLVIAIPLALTFGAIALYR